MTLLWRLRLLFRSREEAWIFDRLDAGVSAADIIREGLRTAALGDAEASPESEARAELLYRRLTGRRAHEA